MECLSMISSLTSIEILEVEHALKTSKEVSMFPPNNSIYWDTSYTIDSQDYLDWLHCQYPSITFEYTNRPSSLAAKITEYLKVKWRFRAIGTASIRHELINLRKEIRPLRKLRDAVLTFREAEKRLKGAEVLTR